MLDIGEQIVQKSDTRSLSEPYWICTTKRFFEEVRYAQAVQNDEGMHIAVDVTYRLSSANNNLDFLGTIANVFNEDRVIIFICIFLMVYCCYYSKCYHPYHVTCAINNGISFIISGVN